MEQRPVTPLGNSNPAQSARSARRSLGEAGGLLLRSGHGSAAAAVQGARAGAASPQSPRVSTGNRSRPSTLTGGAVLLPSRRLTQQQPQPRSRRASLNLDNPSVRRSETQPQGNHHTSNGTNAAGSAEQGAVEMFMPFRQLPTLQTAVAASSHSLGPRAGESGVNPDESAMAAAMEEGNRELLARVRELAALQGQLLVLQRGTASLQAAVSRERRGEDGDVVMAAANRGRRGSAAAADRARVAGTQPSAEVEDVDMVMHPFTCDGCGAGPPLVGCVMTCVECDDYDLCARCYADQDRSGHPRGHQFRQRVPGENPELPQQLMMRFLESTMLHEALRRSNEGDVDRETAAQELAEVRAVETISALPRVMWAAGEPQSKCSECALCLEEYTEEEEVLKLPCAHLFHEGCIGPWFVKSLSCPLCQKEVSA